MNKDDTTRLISLMMIRRVIPIEGRFEITEEMVNQSLELYKIIKPKQTKNSLTNSNLKYARKLAAITFLKESLSRPGTLKPKCGIIYLISNPAFSGMYKVGITQDLDRRLASYQTYDPYRQYKVEHYKFVPDMRAEEKEILNLYKTDVAKGEWVNAEKVRKIFKKSL